MEPGETKEMSKLEHPFAIPIGDWSGDGHGRCEYHHFKSNYPVERLREAYFESKEKYPELSPENFCSSYQDGTLNHDEATLIKDGLGVELEDFPPEHIDPEDHEYYVSSEDLVNVTVAFIKKSLPDWEHEKTNRPPMLPFYGFDKNKRHIGQIGYGLFD